jgi:hypothetical protein
MIVVMVMVESRDSGRMFQALTAQLQIDVGSMCLTILPYTYLYIPPLPLPISVASGRLEDQDSGDET